MTRVADFAALFSGRFDCYAEGFPNPHKPNKYSYAMRREPLTDAVLEAHLAGRKRIGIYPLVDNHVRWFAIDFDAPAGTAPEDAFTRAWEEAENQAAALERAGLFVYLERSRSLQGVHLWGFFDEPVPAALVLTALKPLLLDAETFDRMYPVQSQVTSEGFGNLIALPFQGQSWAEGGTAFLHRTTLEPIALEDFLAQVERNNRYVIEGLAERAPKERKAVVRKTVDGDDLPSFEGRPPYPLHGFLKMISSFGCRFMHHAWNDRATLSQSEWWVAVSQCTVFEHGRQAAHALSRDYPGYAPEEVDALYDRLLQHPPHGCAYIHAHFPEHACTGCPMKAPYHMAKEPLTRLVRATTDPLQKQQWGQAVERVRRRYRGEEDTGLLWHTAGLDRYARLRRAELNVIGARPSVGKTALAVDVSYNLALHGTIVLLFSGETNEPALQDRFLARASGIDSKLLRNEGFRPLTEEEYQELERAAQRLAELPLYINFAATQPEQILGLVEETLLQEGIPLDAPYVVIFDYLQLGSNLDEGFEKKHERVSRIVSAFKYISKVLRAPVIAFSQLTRDAEGEEAPTLDDFAESGQIEKDADVAIVLAGERIPGPKAPRDLWILKHKEGDAGVKVQTMLHQAISYYAPPETPAVAGDLFEADSDAY